MKEFTIIANISNSVLYLGIGNKTTSRLFAELINGNPNEDAVKCLQTATQEFKDRLSLLDDIGERIYGIKQFFTEIPTDQHFFFLSGHIEDSIQIYLYTKYLSEIDNVPLRSTNLERITSYLYDHYEVNSFNGNERLNIGTYDKKKRVCRFCGHSMPDVTFKQKAHAISESLGNKGLVCREECDDCNRRFNETIEQDVIHLFQFHLILKGIKGKKGCPTLQGNGISITNDSTSRESNGRDTLVLKVKTIPVSHDPQEIAKFMSEQFSFSNIKYIPQNIYKCFCKYVLSLINRKYLDFFKGTIDWINESPTHHKLPPLWCYSVSKNIESPYLVVMLRKHEHKDIPYCWAILSIASYQFLFIIPFCSLDKYKFVGKTRVDYFLNGIKNVMPNVNLQPMKLDGITPINLKINANFNIPSDCVEGRDYYYYELDKKQLYEKRHK